MKPTVFHVQSAAEADVMAVRGALDAQGAVLIRDGQFDPASFEVFTEHFCERFHRVGTRPVLKSGHGDGFTTGAPAKNFVLLGHAEGHYRPASFHPDVCFFLCVTPPAFAGGETTLVDGAEMLREIPDWLSKRLEDQGVVYEFSWEPERWRVEFDVFGEDALQELLTRFSDIRYTLKNGVLQMRYAAAAVTKTQDGVPAFVNGVLAHLPEVDHPNYRGMPVHAKPSNRVYFGNGEPMNKDTINLLIDAHDKVLYRHHWQSKDVLIVDNTRYMHGRTMTVEPCERVLISRFGKLRTGGSGMPCGQVESCTPSGAAS